PGTLITQMSSPATPAAFSPSSAPVWRRSVTKSLNFDTTSANFNPGAFCEPSTFSMSSTLKLRLSLFEKRPRPFLHVVGSREHAERRGCEPARLYEGHLEAAVDRLHGVPERDCRLCREICRERARLGHEIGRGDDAIHEADGEGLGGRDRIPGPHQLHGRRLSDKPAETRGAGKPRNQPEVDLRLPEACRVRRDPKSTRHGELASAAKC